MEFYLLFKILGRDFFHIKRNFPRLPMQPQIKAQFISKDFHLIHLLNQQVKNFYIKIWPLNFRSELNTNLEFLRLS